MRWVVAVTAIHAAVAAMAVSPAFFYVNVGTAQRVFGGSIGEKSLYEDVRAYYSYASRTIAGEIPYRDFVVEYPIGALPFFVLPRLIAPTFSAYQWAFAAQMLAIDAVIVWLISRRPNAGRALFWYTLGLASLGPLPIARYDLAPAAMAFAAALAWDAGRPKLGGLLASFGGLVKLFPVVVAGPAFIRDRGRGFVTMILTSILGAGVWILIGGSGVVRAMRYHSGRGLEIESLYAGVLILDAKIRHRPLDHSFNHSSVELITPWAGSAAAVAPFVQIAAMALVLWIFVKRGQRNLVRYAGACLLAFATFGKVLSPQYLLWILPFVAVLEGRAGRWARPVFVACGILTTLVYLWAGVGLIGFHPVAVTILNARSVLLVALFAIVLWREKP